MDDGEEHRLDDRLRDEFNLHLHGHEHRLAVDDTSAHLRLGTGAAYDHEGTVENYFSVLTLDSRNRQARLRVWELTEGSSHRWRPCTRRRFQPDGYATDLNAAHLFPPAATTTAAGTASVSPAEIRQLDTLRQVVGHLEEYFGFRWLTGDYTEVGYAPSVFWPVRLRDPTVIHAVQAFVASALQMRHTEVRLVVDDLGDPETTNRALFESRLRSWMDIVGPNQGDALQISYLLDMLNTPDAAAAGWAVVRNWWSVPRETLINVFRVSKLVADGESFSETAMRSPRRLMSPPMIWAGLALTYPPASSRAIVTLCGDDERLLWDTWQRYCQNSERLPSAHLFIPSLADATGAPIHMAHADMAWRDRVELTRFITDARQRGNYDALHWLSRYCVDLPAELRGEAAPHLIDSEPELTDARRIEALEHALAEIVGV
jgi:hypothetical protein